MKVLIIGGVAGGATTAARLRRRDENATIILFERGEHISYANCGLPYYIGEIISERDNLFVATPELFRKRFKIDVRLKNKVVAVDAANKEVHVKNLDTGTEYTESYDKLVMSPGAEPVKPPIPGVNLPEIFTLRNVRDTDRIKTFVDEKDPKRAVIVGAGFIGLEMAENLHRRDVFVTIVEMAEQVMTPLDYEMAAGVHQHLKTKHVEFYLSDAVKAFTSADEGVRVTLNSGKELDADMVILSIGVRPESKLARDAGLDIGETGGIKVDSHLRTSNPDIFAVGDAIEFVNPIIDRPMLAYLAGPANKQGRICANNLVDGPKHEYTGTLGTAIAKVFDITVAATGVSEKTLKKEKIPHKVSITHAFSHAGYYPDAKPMTLKIQFDPENGKLYGAQIVGYIGVDKRIDLIAATIKRGGTVHDLTEIEHAYAPPFSSAKDPVNIAGFAAENVIQGMVDIVHWQQVSERDPEKDVVLDVRTQAEIELGMIDDAVHIPLDELRQRLDELPRDERIIVYCAAGLRGYLAARILMQHGFKQVVNLTGGYKTFEHATMKQSNEDIFEKMHLGQDDIVYSVDPARLQSAGQLVKVDASGLQCPGPIKRLGDRMKELKPGDTIEIKATDPGFRNDVKSWAGMTGNHLLELSDKKGTLIARVQKGSTSEQGFQAVRANKNGLSLVVFSDDFDKALAAFVLANGALSAGKAVNLFFTFWGLNIIKKQKGPRVRKDLMGRMFGAMMPKGSKDLSLSKMNMAGMGNRMMRDRMKAQNVDSLEDMIQSAIEGGANLIACQMSMDVMGVKAEELVDGVEIGGVASFMDHASRSDVNMFI
ncbi:MAG: FAD-dependent oxidoreductase [candidate division KSB1 bacterium]|nr:FAD-dependent oxidoreductase [candidate division KSB1 bacterium]